MNVQRSRVALWAASLGPLLGLLGLGHLVARRRRGLIHLAVGIAILAVAWWSFVLGISEDLFGDFDSPWYWLTAAAMLAYVALWIVGIRIAIMQQWTAPNA